MTIVLKGERSWTADEFLATDQHDFGDDWRYELIDGRIVGHSAPMPEHGAILAGLTTVLGSRLAGMPGGCRPESGSGATPRTKQRNTARIPDLLIRCGEHPRVAFEVVSQSEIRDWRGRDLKRQHLQAVEGMQEIVELFQDDHAVHVYRLAADGAWTFEAAGGPDAVLRLDSIGISVTLREIYVFAEIGEEKTDER
jgi:Uma2 family endonuclease